MLFESGSTVWDARNSDPMPSTETSATKALVLTVFFDPAINYGFQQNLIPVVNELRFQNDGVAPMDLVIRKKEALNNCGV